jgi:hypothetical protein
MKVQGAGQSHSSSNEPIVIGGGNSDDKIRVTPNKMGGVDVTVMNAAGQSRSYSLTAEEAERLVIRGGKGNDKIKVDAGVTQHIPIIGGQGHDVVVRERRSKEPPPDRTGHKDRGRDDTSTDVAMWDVKSNQPA